MRRRPIRAILACAIATLAAARPTTALARSFDLGPFGVLGLDVPEGWSVKSEKPADSHYLTISLRPPGEVQLVLLISPIPVSEKKDPVEAARHLVENELRARLAATAVESSLPVHTMSGPNVQAFYVSGTDKTVSHPTAEEFKFVDQGVSAMGRLILTFTLLTNAKDAPERAAAREIVRTAVLAPPRPPRQTPEGTVRLPAPGPKWSLAIDLPGFALDPIQIREDPPGTKLSAVNRTAGLILTAFIETAKPGWTAVDARENAWNIMQTASPMERKDVKRSERGDIALLEYSVPRYKGEDLNQRSVNAYMVRDGMWIDVHISKTQYEPNDDALFQKVIGTIRIVDQK